MQFEAIPESCFGYKVEKRSFLAVLFAKKNKVPYSAPTSCKKAKKLLQKFSRSEADQLTNQPTNQLTGLIP